MRSSQRATAEGSTPATLAISSVSSWSEFPAQPLGQLLGNLSAAASEFTLDCDDAIHNPPLVHGNFSPWPGPLHKEDQGNHTQNSSAEEPKIIDIGQHVGLPKQIALHQPVSPMHSINRGEAAGFQQ